MTYLDCLDYSSHLFLDSVGGWSGMAFPFTRRTGVPDVIERGETFMSNPALSAGSDLDGLKIPKALGVGCISGLDH